MQTYKLLAIIILGLTSPPLQAEVQSVVMRWIPSRCQESCQERLSKAFEKSREIDDFTINDANGSASLTWNTDSKFSYRDLKRPMQRVGVGIDSISVVVRGKIRKVGKNVILTSEGDGTKFYLVSYDDRKPTSKNLLLDPKLEEQLVNSKEIYVVRGPLYQAHRSPPLYLITSKVQIEK